MRISTSVSRSKGRLVWNGKALQSPMLQSSDDNINKQGTVDNGHGNIRHCGMHQLNLEERITDVIPCWQTAYKWECESRRCHIIMSRTVYMFYSRNCWARCEDYFLSDAMARDQTDLWHGIYRSGIGQNWNEKLTNYFEKWAYSRYRRKFWRWKRCKARWRYLSETRLHNKIGYSSLSGVTTRDGFTS